MAAPLNLAGSDIGRYRVVSLLGTGGMGEVYDAIDSSLGRHVALKILKADAVHDPKRLSRFVQEARSASTLNHPHLVSIYEIGEHANVHFIAMEKIDGSTLRAIFSFQRLPVKRALELMIQITEAVAAAHGAGVIHRDLKPENIMVSLAGYAKVLDFGLAKLQPETALSADPSASTFFKTTESGTVLGTVGYMSPEQAQGKPADPRSDIFSLGCIFYEAVAGKRAFHGTTSIDTLHAVIHNEPAPLRESAPDTPIELQRIIRKALAKDPEERYQSAKEMAIDLRNAGKVERPAAAVRARPWLPLSMGVATVLVALAIAWLLLNRGRRPAVAQAEYAPLTNFADSAVAPGLSPDGRILAFIRGENTFMGPGEIYVKLLPDGEPVQLTHDGLAKMGPTVFWPDGSRIAYTVGNETWTVPTLGGDPRRMLAGASGLTWIDAGAGRSRVLFSKYVGEGIHMGIFTASESGADEKEEYIPSDVNGMAHRSSLSPDHKSVLVVEMDVTGWLPCRLIPFDGSSLGIRAGPSPAQCTDAAWSPDGKWMYFSANVGNGFHIWRQRFPDGSPEEVTYGATEEQGIAFAPDGHSFLTSVGESQSTISVHDPTGDRQVTSQGYAYLPSFSADGKRLYYLQRSSANRRFVSGELWVTNLESGKRERVLPNFLMEHYNVSPDDNHLVFVSADDAGHSPVWLATLDGSSAPRRFVPFDSVRALFGSNDDVFFVGGEKRSMFLYHVNADGSQLRKVVPDPVIFLYDVSPDGKWLAAWVRSSVVFYPVNGGPPILICRKCGTAGEQNRGVTPPLVRWSRNGKFLYLHNTSSRQTYAVQLRDGETVPALPASGFRSMGEVSAFLHAWAIPQQRAFPGSDPSIYAFPRVATHRNIYRVQVP